MGNGVEKEQRARIDYLEAENERKQIAVANERKRADAHNAALINLQLEALKAQKDENQIERIRQDKIRADIERKEEIRFQSMQALKREEINTQILISNQRMEENRIAREEKRDDQRARDQAEERRRKDEHEERENKKTERHREHLLELSKIEVERQKREDQRDERDRVDKLNEIRRQEERDLQHRKSESDNKMMMIGFILAILAFFYMLQQKNVA